MIEYTISYPSGTLRKNGVIFPIDVANADYQAYAAWQRAGNGPIAIDDPALPPARQHITVSAWQIRKALNQQGLREQVESAVANCGDVAIQDGWQYSAEWNSDHPLLLAMLPALGMTEDQMYSIFELAKTL